MTSRLEWFWREAYPKTDFTPKKPLAHEIAARVVEFLVSEVIEQANKKGTTPYAEMWSYAENHS